MASLHKEPGTRVPGKASLASCQAAPGASCAPPLGGWPAVALQGAGLIQSRSSAIV
jgi:hypothetical protein